MSQLRGTFTTGGGIFTVTASDKLKLSGTISTTSGAITINARQLELTSAVTTSGGTVTITLGTRTGTVGNYVYSGKYINATDADLSKPGFVWTTTGKNMILNVQPRFDVW